MFAKQLRAFRWFIAFAVLTLLFFGFQTAFAAHAGQTGTEPTPGQVGMVDVLLLGSIVAFFKARFPAMPAWGVLLIVAGVSLPMALAPRIEAAFPFLTGWFMDIINWFRLFMFAAGGYDLLTDAGPKVLARV